MNCPICGTDLLPGTPMCPVCGNVNQNQSAPVTTKSSNKNGLIATVCFLLSLVLIVVSIIVPLATPLFDIPAISFIMNMADGEADTDALMDELEHEYKYAKEMFKTAKNDMSSKEKREVSKLIDASGKVVDNFSVLNVKALMKAAKNSDSDLMDFSSIELDEVAGILNVVIGIAIAFFVLPLIFALLGGLKKKTGLLIAAAIFTAFSQLILCGFVMVILSLIVYIAEIAFIKKLNA